MSDIAAIAHVDAQLADKLHERDGHQELLVLVLHRIDVVTAEIETLIDQRCALQDDGR